MNDRKTVRPGDEIIIRIEQREKPISTATAQNAPKAMIRVRRPADFLPRRINGGGGINFYDLAQKKNGDGWATIPASIAKAEGDAFFDDFTDASKADLKTQTENQIFAVPFSEWKNVFFKIKKGDDFARLIRVRYDEHGAPAGNTLDALDRWENGGLRLSADEAATFGFVGEQSGLFASFGTSPPVLSQPDQLYKITAERRADASSVPFTPSRKTLCFSAARRPRPRAVSPITATAGRQSGPRRISFITGRTSAARQPSLIAHSIARCERFKPIRLCRRIRKNIGRQGCSTLSRWRSRFHDEPI